MIIFAGLDQGNNGHWKRRGDTIDTSMEQPQSKE